MTRINVGIEPQELCNQHLFAEYREIKRVSNNIIKGKFSMVGQPKEFTLGTGHVKWAYDKLLYLKNRNDQLYQECLKRGIKATDYSQSYIEAMRLHPELANDYVPTERDRKIIRERINERLKTMKK